MSDNKHRLIEILDRLPPERVVELVEFAEFLESKERRGVPRREAIMAIQGRYKDVLRSTEQVQAERQDEFDLEDGRL